MDIKYTVLDESLTPTRAHESDAGFDLRSRLSSRLHIGQRRKFPTGVRVSIPHGYVGLVCSRSGLPDKYGVHVLNDPGIIDSGFTGEIMVNLHNAGETGKDIGCGDRIAQILFIRLADVELKLSDDLGDSERGENGHGSTGV